MALMILYDQPFIAIAAPLWTVHFLLCFTIGWLPAIASYFDQALSVPVAIILSKGMEFCHAA